MGTEKSDKKNIMDIAFIEEQRGIGEMMENMKK